MGHIGIVIWLLEVCNAVVDHALLIAAGMRYLQIIIWLFQEGRASVNQANADGWTPLLAAYKGTFEPAFKAESGRIRMNRAWEESQSAVEHPCGACTRVHHSL
jgi:hypothetical protein